MKTSGTHLPKMSGTYLVKTAGTVLVKTTGTYLVRTTGNITPKIDIKVKGRHGRLPQAVSPERVLQLEQELAEKTNALAELSVAFTLLEKKDRAESLAQRQAKLSPRRLGP